MGEANPKRRSKSRGGERRWEEGWNQFGRRRWGGKAARIDKGEYVGSSREMRARERETEIRQPKTSGGDCPKEANGYYHGLNGKQILGFFKRIAL